MTFKKRLKASLALCLAAIFAATGSGCDDLGAFSDTTEYYGSFGDVVAVRGADKSKDSYSVEDYFYNDESRENFLEGEDGSYEGIPILDYLYLAIPIESSLEMDSLALYVYSESDCMLLLSVYVTDTLPTKPKGVGDPDKETVEEDGVMVEKDVEYDDPSFALSVGNLTVFLDGGKWDSFLLDKFSTWSGTSNTLQVSEGQYILIQIRNNSGIRSYDEQTGAFVDPVTGIVPSEANITFTNLLVRALKVGS